MKTKHKAFCTRTVAVFLLLLCVLGLFPATASAALPDSIKLEKFGYSGVAYESDALGRCQLHQMYYAVNDQSKIGFCAEKGMSMGNSLIGQTWGSPVEITDPTVRLLTSYFYTHTEGVFTDAAIAAGVNTIWDPGYTWYMNAWVQAVIWRYEQGTLGDDPVVACAEELMAVYNTLEGTNYTSIDDVHGNESFRHRTQYIFDLGSEVWGECSVKKYDFTGAGTADHPAAGVQSVIVGELLETEEEYTLIIKKVDASNPTKGLPGARFLVESTSGGFSQEVITGADGSYKFSPIDPNTYQITEIDPPPGGYKIDNPGPVYAVVPNNSDPVVTVTFTNSLITTGEGSIRKVDTDDPTKGLAGSVIRIIGVDNNYSGTFTTGDGGYLEGVPWDTMPIGSFVAEEVTPPEGYTLSPDPKKVRQEFYWDGQTDVALVFENDAKVKVELLKLDDSDNPLPGAVFNIFKDGQLIGSQATDREGKIIVPNVTEGLFAFVEVSAPAPFARLMEPVLAYVDQATVEGGGTITVSAADKKLPNLQIKKLDKKTKEPVPDTVFEIKGIAYGYHQDVTTNAQGVATLTGIPVDSYEVREVSVPSPYCIAEEDVQTIFLAPGADQELIFENDKQPLLTLSKISFGDEKPVPGTVLTVEGIDNAYKDDWTTGTDGTVTKYVPAGTYRITEKFVPLPLYLPDKDADRVQEISLNPGDEKTVQFINHKMPELTIYKESDPGNAPVEGTRFHVTYVSNGAAAEAPASYDFGEFLTDENGEIKLHESGKRLYPGEYTVTEVEPSSGFLPSKTPTQKVILNGSESKTLTFRNQALNAIVVEKYDSVSSEAIASARFQLRYLSGESGTGGTIIGQKSTGRNGTAIWTGLQAGTYIVEEIDPADGYSIIQSSETVHLADNGEQSVVTVRFENAPDGMLLIRKVCSVNPSITLQDAEFKVTYADGSFIGDSNGIYRTDENGEIRIEGLKPGKSVIVTEVTAPPGFLIDTQSQTIQTKAGKTVSLTFKNQPTGELIISKRDFHDRSVVLPGALFRVTTAAGCEVGLDGVIGTSTLTQNGIFTTDSNGEIRLTNLAPGAYVITEIQAPEGYVIDNPITNVVIGTNGDTQTVEITNSKKGSIVIVKKSENGTPLQGVEFTVKTSSGDVIANKEGDISTNGIYYTDENGQIIISGLEPDTYVVTETATLPGYVLDTTPRIIALRENATHTEVFINKAKGALVINKLSSADRKTPLEGVTFKITYANGEFVPNAGGKISSNGLYYTDAAGQIVISGVTGTLVVTELESIPGYTIDETTRSQTVVVNPDDVQTLTFYNDPIGGVEIIKVNEDDPTERIPNTFFEIRKMDDELVDTITTDKNGRAFLPLEDGAYYAVETVAGKGFRVDSTPIYFEIEEGKTELLEVTNKAFSGILIHKIDSKSREGIYGVRFLLYDANKNPIGEYVSDDEGYVYIDNLPDGGGRYYLRELSNEGYIVDEKLRTVYVESGATEEIVWENTAVTGQIQVHKYAAEPNHITGTAAGTPLAGAVYEIIDPRTSKVVDHITTDARGIAASKPLPLMRYQVREVTAPAYWQVDTTVHDVTLEFAGQIIKISAYDKPSDLGVSITKRGNASVLAGSQMRYDFTFANTSNVDLESFYFHDRIPTDIARAATLTTGTYSMRLNYRVLYKTNYTASYQVLATNLLTTNNYSFGLNAIPMQAGEYVTDVYFDFGKVPVGFQSVANPTLSVVVNGTAVNGYQMVNRADVGGKYQGTWQTAQASWVTIVQRYWSNPTLPKTGY